MKTPHLFGLLALVLLLTSCSTGKKSRPASDLYQQITSGAAPYDSSLAVRLGADAYGMKPYVMAFLKSGPNRSQNPEEAAQLQKAHLENITRLAEAGKLVLAGPFLDNSDVRGIYIFNVATVEEARALTETDPAIQAGRLVMELHPWYGSAALPLLNPLHGRLQQKSIAE